MEISVETNKTYVVAVSGGVDSMVLLNLISKKATTNNWKVIVTHVDHGIRSDSKEDKELVESVAKTNGLIFESVELSLGPATSEATARAKRYEFLEAIKTKHSAFAIITAHHQDDLLETAILNLIRGTGRKGLTALTSSSTRLRPLIDYSKSQIIEYAKTNNIIWREDSTNTDTSYLRNYIRLNFMPQFDNSARLKLLDVINKMRVINTELDKSLAEIIKLQPNFNEIDRIWFNNLSHGLGKEILASWLRLNNLGNFNSLTLERLVVSAKVARVGQRFPVINNSYMCINKHSLSLS